MRKIECDMLEAIKDGRDWQRNNTAVINEACGIVVYLHGHRLGYIPTWEGRKVSKFVPCVETFESWPTQTTASRLRALGVEASIKNGRPYINY